MANMLLATIAIKKSVANATQYAKEQISGTVYLQPDTSTLRNAQKQTGTDTKITLPTINESLAQGIAQSPYIKDYTYSIVTSANADGYTVVQTAQNEREQEFKNALNSAKDQAQDQVNEFNSSRDTFNKKLSGGRRDSSGFNYDLNLNFSNPSLSRGDTAIQGINSFNFISDVENGSMKIIDGKPFDESTKNGIVISKELADANNLSVGSTISFKTTASTADERHFTIVGLYENSTEDFNTNTVYTNIDGAKQFMTDDQLKNLSLQNVRYYLTSAEDKNAFLSASKSKYDLSSHSLTLKIDDSAYQTMVGPIEHVGSFATTVFWIVAAAAATIITLIVAINVKDRRYEMGVLLSLGAKRSNIIGQIFIELAIIGTIGFALSLGTSHFIAQRMGDALLAQQISASKTESSDTFEQRGMNARAEKPKRSNAKQINTIQVSTGPSEYAILFGSGYLILVIAMIIPSITLLRYQPKAILAGKE